MAQTPTGIEVRAKFFPLALLLLLFPPTVEINGQAHPAKWGTTFFPGTPGTVTVKAYFKYLFLFPQCNKAEIQVTVAPGQVAKVSYKARWLIFLPGKISVETVTPATPAVQAA
jgi:hypothetical protein